MARKSYLISRGGRWYYNRAYPKSLWPIVGTSPFRLALNTETLEEAQRQRGRAEQLYWAAVDEARSQAAPFIPRELTDIEAMGLVAQWFKSTLEQGTELLRAQVRNPFDLDEVLEQVDDYEAEARQAVAEDEMRLADDDAQRLLKVAGLTASRTSPSYTDLRRGLLRARRELALGHRARLLGKYDWQPSDPLLVSALALPEVSPSPKHTIEDLIAAYEGDRGSRWAPSTRDAYQPVWRLLRDCLGAKRDVATITRDDGRKLFDTVKALPSGLGKRKALQGLTVVQAAARASELGLPTLKPHTINGSYMGLLASAFEWAVKEQWLTANPVAGLTVADDVDAADKRDPFTANQLATIFGSAPWAPRNDAPRGKPLHFWGPLIALFLGMRRGEIAQLNVADIETVDGIEVIQVRPGADGQRVKTRAGRRMLPIHPELKAMGFLDFVAAQRRAGERQLFPGEAPNVRGQWGDALSDWFLRLLANHKIAGRKLGMHSFRHNFEDRLRAAGLRGTDIGKELAGRSKGADVGDKYGSGYAAVQLAEAVGRISYPDLDLSHLHLPGALDRRSPAG